MSRWTALVAVTFVTCVVSSASTARALTASEIECQSTIGREARRFAGDALDAAIDCHDAVVDGETCDESRRDALTARAQSRFVRRVTHDCTGVTLADLGFPDGCADTTGGEFGVEDLTQCLADAVRARIAQVLATAYPQLGAHTGDVDRCQTIIGRQAARFFDGKLRARSRCLELAVKHAQDHAGVACLAEPPPAGPGTGDRKTDQTILKFSRRLQDKIRRACDGVDLAELGFPGDCADASGAFSLDDLQTCLLDRVETAVDRIAALAFAEGGITPSPTPSATPTASGVSASPESPTPTTTTTGSPSGPCVLPSPIPEILSLVANPGTDLDTGWTGISHDLRGVDNASLTALRLTDCDLDPDSPSCGQCSVEGPVAFPGSRDNCFCLNAANRDASSLTACDPEMPSSCTGGGESCACFYGPPLPISSGAVPVCVLNVYDGPVTGTVNIADSGPAAGTSSTLIHLTSIVHNGLTVDRPCPICMPNPNAGQDDEPANVCSAGPREGEACDVAGVHPFFGPVSFTCPPPAAADVGALDVTFNPATTGTTTLGTGPSCTAFGATDLQCFCDTCATAAAEPCNSDADCPNGVTCGGRRCIGGTASGTPCANAEDCPGGGVCDRPGEASRPNGCSNGVCVANPADPDNPNEGRCELGPNDNLCSIETFRGCVNSADCNPPPAGNCATCVPNQTCTVRRRECFLDPIVRTGMAGTQDAVLAATFCISPTRSPAVNSVSGLPGPGALLLPVSIFRGSEMCGNGTQDAGEECDPPMDGACPGACQPDCTCGPFCGDQMINQPTEQCDAPQLGTCTAGCEADCTCTPVCGNGVKEGAEECDDGDDVACPGACQGDCTCGPFCGDNTVDPGEECDGTGSTACPPSACQADCTCGPFCGDANIDPGEECDATSTGSCAGTCDVDCTCAPFCGNGVLEGSEQCETGNDAACPGNCTDCTCGPVVGTVSFVARPGSDLDNGWTGQSHNGTIQAGAAITGQIAACDGISDFECTFLANVGSFCSGDPSRNCTETSQCVAGQTCVVNRYGAPQPLSSGGVPVCLISRFAEDVTGTYNIATGAASIRIPLNTLVYFSPDVSQPCPVCNCGAANLQDCQIGQTGTCEGFGANPGGACRVDATGPFGPTSNDCEPVPAANVSGGGVRAFYDPATTGVVSFPSSQPCDAPGFEGQSCWCDGQLRPNACVNACDGGDRDAQACSSDAECPNAPAGACRPLCRQITGEPLGEGFCPAGPADLRCAGAEEIGCVILSNPGTPEQTDTCPTGTGPCESGLRRCFLDPIQREGTPGTDTNVLASAICLPATGAAAIDTNTGLPGPGALRLFNTVVTQFCGNGIVSFPEECEVGDDANCPGACQADCRCPRTCGNGTIEFGEQCEAGNDAACPGQCAAPGGAGECTCPAMCGDGFVGPGEQCDPGGTGGSPPASDAACPGACGVTCQCPAAVCGNGMIEAGETCELPAVGCGPLQQCSGCTACTP